MADPVINIVPPGQELPVKENNHPIVYVDHILGMGIGAFVSRLTFGIESNQGAVGTSMTLVLPTNVMQVMADQIQLALANKDIQSNIKTNHMELQRKMAK